LRAGLGDQSRPKLFGYVATNNRRYFSALYSPPESLKRLAIVPADVQYDKFVEQRLETLLLRAVAALDEPPPRFLLRCCRLNSARRADGRRSRSPLGCSMSLLVIGVLGDDNELYVSRINNCAFR
jgi:hypothetical protein